MSFLWAILLMVILLIAWVLTLLGMPGNWVMVVAVALFVLLVPEQSAVAIGWGVVVALLLLAALGELLEFLAGAIGVTKAGGSKRGAVLALLGSLAGGIIGLFVGVPIPFVGSIVAVVLFAGLGALAGAVLGEQWRGRSLDQSWQIGKAAFWGRLLGTLAKTAIGAVMVGVTAAALLL